MTKYPDIFGALAAEFRPNEVKARTQAGRQMQYVTARTVMNRLDEVVGPENWWDDYQFLDKSCICRLTIRLPGGEIVTKVDAGGFAGLSDEGDDDKSAVSDAFKRAAVKFGPGRYLYRDGVASLGAKAAALNADLDDRLARYAAAASEQSATLPLPKPPAHQLPDIRTARELFVFAKANRLLPVLGEMGRKAGLPPRIVDWENGNARALWEQYVEGLPAFSRNGTDG